MQYFIMNLQLKLTSFYNKIKQRDPKKKKVKMENPDTMKLSYEKISYKVLLTVRVIATN